MGHGSFWGGVNFGAWQRRSKPGKAKQIWWFRSARQRCLPPSAQFFSLHMPSIKEPNIFSSLELCWLFIGSADINYLGRLLGGIAMDMQKRAANFVRGLQVYWEDKTPLEDSIPQNGRVSHKNFALRPAANEIWQTVKYWAAEKKPLLWLINHEKRIPFLDTQMDTNNVRREKLKAAEPSTTYLQFAWTKLKTRCATEICSTT